MAQSNEEENVSTSDKKDLSPARPPRQKKIRCSALEIDRYLELKWGLALLGEERGKEYLDWLRKKIDQEAH